MFCGAIELEKKRITKNTRKEKGDRSIDLSSRRGRRLMSTTRSETTTTTTKVAFDSSSRPRKTKSGRSSLITADRRREYLSLPNASRVRWQQSTTDVEIHVKLPRGASEKKGDVSVRVTSTSVRVRLNGHDWGTKGEPLAGTLFRRIKTDESSWTIVRRHVERARTNRSPLFSLSTRTTTRHRIPTSCIYAFERIETSSGNQSSTTIPPTGSFRTRSSRIWSTPTKARRRSRTKSYRWKVNSWWKRCGREWGCSRGTKSRWKISKARRSC